MFSIDTVVRTNRSSFKSDSSQPAFCVYSTDISLQQYENLPPSLATGNIAK